MSNYESESSQRDQPNVVRGRSMVRIPAGSYKLTDEDRRLLEALAQRADSEIDFSDIPQLTDEEKERAVQMIAEQRARRLQKAN